MKLSIVSASGTVLTAEKFDSLTIMTEAGEITILDHHEPLISAVRPGILHVDYYIGNKVHTANYATGGGVLHITTDTCTILADVIENEDNLTDMEYIESQKKEAEKLIKIYQEENGETVDPHRLIELEYELLRYTAMHRLGKKFHESKGGRR